MGDCWCGATRFFVVVSNLGDMRALIIFANWTYLSFFLICWKVFIVYNISNKVHFPTSFTLFAKFYILVCFFTVKIIMPFIFSFRGACHSLFLKPSFQKDKQKKRLNNENNIVGANLRLTFIIINAPLKMLQDF